MYGDGELRELVGGPGSGEIRLHPYSYYVTVARCSSGISMVYAERS